MSEIVIEIKQQIARIEHSLIEKRQLAQEVAEQVARLTEQLEQEHVQIAELEQQLLALGKIESQSPKQTEPAGSILDDKSHKHIELVAESSLFDAEWYLETYPDIAESEAFAANPAAHYVHFGGYEGRKPSPEFDSKFYMDQHKDVADAGLNPLVHYLLSGHKENRAIAPWMLSK